jgi:anaerobic ribonucleoside-triphosphate reductase activating protein
MDKMDRFDILQHHKCSAADVTTLNIAATCQATYALGPGLRSAAWVQGCPFRCTGCISPDWIQDISARRMTPQELADELLEDPHVTGVTFSGGEPMQQAAGLAETVRLARKQRDISVVCFTGYRYEELVQKSPVPGVGAFLGEIDVLIDGPFIAGLNENRGLRGSANQRIYYLTNRLASYFLEETPRRAEIQIQDGQVFLVGIPPRGMNAAFASALYKLEKSDFRMIAYERT